jgi:hypothetical protein
VCRAPPLLNQHDKSIVKSGCTGHFLLVNAPCLDKVKSRTPLTVGLPNDATMESSHTAELDIPKLKAAASKAHVFPGMANQYLLSVGHLCDEGYIVTFKQDTVTICDSRNSQILSGTRDLNTGLWRINLRKTNKHIPDHIANNVYDLRKPGVSVHYLHKDLFSLPKSALFQAVKDGHLTFETDACHGLRPYDPAASKYTIHLEGANWDTTKTGHIFGHKDPTSYTPL